MDEIDDLAEAVADLEAAIDQGPEPIHRSEIAVPEPEDNGYQKPWERLPEERADHHWLLFEHYRDSGMARTIVGTYDWYVTTELPTIEHADSLYKLSAKFRWAERVEAWDNENERLYQLARSQAVREMVDRHGDQIEGALAGLMAPIDALNRRIEEDPEFLDSLSKTSAAKLIGLANTAARTMPSLMSAERLARGMPTEIVGGTVDVQHTHRIERDHIGEILETLEQAGVLDGRGDDLGAGEVIDAEVVEFHSVPAEGDE